MDSSREKVDGCIVLFDGECALCSGAARFILRHDRRGYFRFAALNTQFGRELLSRSIVRRGLDTVVLIEDGAAYTQSTAALRIAGRLDWPWMLLSALLVIPAVVRDPIYAAVARYRYRFFGRRAHCALPEPGASQRMIH